MGGGSVSALNERVSQHTDIAGRSIQVNKLFSSTTLGFFRVVSRGFTMRVRILSDRGFPVPLHGRGDSQRLHSKR